MFEEHSQVVLTKDLPSLGLEAGDVGVIVHIHAQGKAYEVEFITLDGETIGVETIEESKLRPVGRREIPHVRQLLAA
jgi:Domain of unknown function (DUF4926)